MIRNIVVKREKHRDGSISCNHYIEDTLIKSTYSKKTDLFEMSREEILENGKTSIKTKIVYPDMIETHNFLSLGSGNTKQMVDIIELLDSDQMPIYYSRMRNLYFDKLENVEDDFEDEYLFEPNRDFSEYSIYLEKTEDGYIKKFSRSNTHDNFNPIYVGEILQNNGSKLIEYVSYNLQTMDDIHLNTMGQVKYFDENKRLIRLDEFASAINSTDPHIDTELSEILKEYIYISNKFFYEYDESGDLVTRVEVIPSAEGEVRDLYSYFEV